MIEGDSEVKIRNMQTEDLGEVCPILGLAVPFARPEEVRKWTKRALRDFPLLCLVAELEGRIVGGLSGFKRSGTLGEINEMAVRPGHQGKGIGRKLLKAELEEFKRSGTKIVRAVVPIECAASIPFYYNHGFRVSKCARNYYGPGQDVIILARSQSGR